jgi:uncharacterized protein (TIGR02421 family)
MIKLSIEEIIKKIKRKEVFDAVVDDNSFQIKINRYVPYVCTAIHAGSNLRPELKEKSALNDYERWYEEDPYTDEFIAALPITIVGNDSRYEYDLNRAPEVCIFEEAWGKSVWKKPLTKAEKQVSLKKHTNYYRVTYALIKKLEELFDGCVVYDMHSYNYKRWDRAVPVFNIGAEKIDSKFKTHVESWNNHLKGITIPELETTAAIDDVFKGMGYNLAFINQHFDNTLVLATEVKKVFCDELGGIGYPSVIRSLKSSLKKAILNHANEFAISKTNWQSKRKSTLLNNQIDPEVLKVDKQLYDLVKNFELLQFVNPINIEREKKAFFKNKFSVNPSFKYRPIKIDPFTLKRKLYSIKADKIEDIEIQKMYENTISAYADKIDLLATIGSKRFFYNSLGYFGSPSDKDLRNARYLLSLPKIDTERKTGKKLTAQDAKKAFEESFDFYGFKANVGISKDLAAEAMVLNQQKKVLVKENALFSQKELDFLVHHEIGVHMVTTMNSNLQPLKLFNVGTPVNTYTQEGLAVLSEYLSGNLTLKRLRTLGLRVIAIDMMVKKSDFKTIFAYITNEYNVDKEEAFILLTRVFRGGGFTKDYLYLKGFANFYKLWNSGYDLTPLLIGKTSIKNYNTIVEMMDRKLIERPKFISEALLNPNTHKNGTILEYIVNGLL